MKKIGFDLGDTIFHRVEGARVLHDDAFETIKTLVRDYFGAENCYIVSKVTPEQKIGALKFLAATKFHKLTGLPEENVIFCAERHEKAPICESLGITHFVDDRPEVLSHMTSVPNRILFKAIEADYEIYKDKLVGVVRVESWKEIARILFT